MNIEPQGEVAVWDIAINSDQGIAAAWTRATAPTTSTAQWGAAGILLAVDVVIRSGTVQWKIDGQGDWAALVSGTSLTTPPPGVALAFRTAVDSVAASIQVAAKTRLP